MERKERLIGGKRRDEGRDSMIVNVERKAKFPRW